MQQEPDQLSIPKSLRAPPPMRGMLTPPALLLETSACLPIAELTAALPRERVHFRKSRPLTLGVEIELQLIDPANLQLVARAIELLRACYKLAHLKPEFYQSTIELCTGVCRDVHGVGASFLKDVEALSAMASALEIALAMTGCHPITPYSDCRLMPGQRYRELIDRNQWLTRRMTVYGLHVHLGMRSGEECIRFYNGFHNYLPHLLALSASSPFWQGHDTGLATCRPTTYAALPTAGQSYELGSWSEFEDISHALARTGSIGSLKDLWWDMRPSPNFGTLEIRICDAPATLAETLAITAFIHLLALLMAQRFQSLETPMAPPNWIMRENKWRAMRFGLDAELLTDAAGNVRPLKEEIEELLEAMAPDIERLGYHDYVTTLRQVLIGGNSAARQRSVLLATGSMEQVVTHNVREFERGHPVWVVPQRSLGARPR
jgi:carboxylate-amine ligase